jgi:hypothetical protein
MSSSLTLTGDHRRDLDDWIDVCLWKYTLAPRALYVETHDA